LSTDTDRTRNLRPVLPTRRAALALGGVMLAAPALAQPRFPDRPIRLVFPWPSGGSADAQIRSMCETASRVLGQPVVIESRPGAAGTLGPQQVAAQARPDGYTLTVMHHTVMRWPFMTRTPRWDPVSDFTHVIGIAGWLFGTVVKADSRFGSWQDVVAAARANPGKLTFGATGAGSSPHLTMVEIQEKLGIELTHVPYRGGAEAMTIQGQRVIATTGIKCVGNTVVLHGVPYAPPYRISAIGDPRKLQAALESAEYIKIYRQYVDAFHLGYEVTVSARSTFPGYQGSVDLRYATAFDSPR